MSPTWPLERALLNELGELLAANRHLYVHGGCEHRPTMSSTPDTTITEDLVYCSPPEDVDGAHKFEDGTTNYSVHSFVHYACVYTHDLVKGNVTRFCMENGEWSGTPPVCSRNNTKAYWVGGTITAACILVLIFLPLDFLRYQKKRARVREISQRRSHNQHKTRPTSFFVNKMPVPYWTPTVNPVIPQATHSDSELEMYSRSQHLAQDSDRKGGRLILPPISAASRQVASYGDLTCDTQSSKPKRVKRKKKKLIPSKTRQKSNVVEMYGEEDMGSSAADLVARGADNGFKWGKKSTKVDPLSDDNLVQNGGYLSENELKFFDASSELPPTNSSSKSLMRTLYIEPQAVDYSKYDLQVDPPDYNSCENQSVGLQLLWDRHLQSPEHHIYNHSSSNVKGDDLALHQGQSSTQPQLVLEDETQFCTENKRPHKALQTMPMSAVDRQPGNQYAI